MLSKMDGCLKIQEIQLIRGASCCVPYIQEKDIEYQFGLRRALHLIMRSKFVEQLIDVSMTREKQNEAT